MGSEDKKKMIFMRWRTAFDFKTILNAHGSLLVTFLFALYNGFLGLWHSSFWHGSIGVYYILLVLIRGTIIGTERRLFSQRNQDGKSSKDGKALKDANAAREKESAGKVRRAVYQVNVVLLLILNICMIGPIMMLPLSAVSSGAMWLMTVLLTISALRMNKQ